MIEVLCSEMRQPWGLKFQNYLHKLGYLSSWAKLYKRTNKLQRECWHIVLPQTYSILLSIP